MHVLLRVCYLLPISLCLYIIAVVLHCTMIQIQYSCVNNKLNIFFSQQYDVERRMIFLLWLLLRHIVYELKNTRSYVIQFSINSSWNCQKTTAKCKHLVNPSVKSVQDSDKGVGRSPGGVSRHWAIACACPSAIRQRHCRLSLRPLSSMSRSVVL